MASESSSTELKRKLDAEEENGSDAGDEEWVGPMPSEASQQKKRKG